MAHKQNVKKNNNRQQKHGFDQINAWLESRCSFVHHIFVMIKNNLSTKTPSGDNRLFCVKTNLGILFAVFHSLNIYCTPKGAKQTNRMNYSPSWYCAQNMVYKTVRCCFSFFICFSLKTSGKMEKKDNKFASAG